MHSSEISTGADVVLDHAFCDQIFNLLVPVFGKCDLAVILREKSLNPRVILENPPRWHHERPLLRFVCVNTPREVDPGEFEGSFAKSCLSPDLRFSSLLRFDHLFQLWKHVEVPIYEKFSLGAQEGVDNGTSIGEFDLFRDCLVPFRIPNGEIKRGVSGFDKLGMDTDTTVSGENMDWHTGRTYFSVPVCLHPCFPEFSASRHRLPPNTWSTKYPQHDQTIFLNRKGQQSRNENRRLGRPDLKTLPDELFAFFHVGG